MNSKTLHNREVFWIKNFCQGDFALENKKGGWATLLSIGEDPRWQRRVLR
jgi:hypothetical protein